jgi:hypothetical protein
MTRSAYPPAVSPAPRPWLSRAPGECAFPVAGEGVSTLACCNPSGARSYCAAHRRAMRGPQMSSAARYEENVLQWLETRQ